MTISQHMFGETTVAKLSEPFKLKKLLVDPWFESETIIIKPNWVSTMPGHFTSLKTLRLLLENLDSKIVVTESSTHVFNEPLEDGLNFIAEGKEQNWKWLLAGHGWKWLIKNPNWDWFKRDGHWDHLKKGVKTFLDQNGYTDLFNEFNVTYINVTDEIWSGRIADQTEVKKIVGEYFKPIDLELDKLYSMVPKKLYDLRGSLFISLAKLKHYASFTMKNIFGMIPDPLRPWWHGTKDVLLPRSIIAINKIYHALFNIYGICEALDTRSVFHPEGKFKDEYSGLRYRIVEDPGFFSCGRDLVSLDAILGNLGGFDPKSFNYIINLAEKEFGTYDREVLKESKLKLGTWLQP
ncbi:MAG: hypothetical protein Lokiarch_44130 [Candidatus Lokiarchaeum sp. GC14_75]|nr:MAG: hypothetical protein Lokiarch_44130 [Candidatus Lokiarchaeum sp. GC14_75]